MSNVGQAITGVVGGIIGFYVGGPTGAVTGFQVGAGVGTALFPTQLPGLEGPRLEDFESLHADPGSPVFQVYGTVAVPGFRMYLGNVTEVGTTEEVGGKGPPEQQVTTFQYFQTLAVGLCEGPISGIGRVWENGQLVYDPRPQYTNETAADYAARVSMNTQYESTFVLYLGDESQLADPTMELEQGAGTVPAFRGLAYIVFPDRELKSDQANRHPNLKIEVIGRGELVLTSRPYAVEVLEGVDSIPAVQNSAYAPDVQESINISGDTLNGTLQSLLIEYDNYDPESIDVGGDTLNGTLDVVLITYDEYDPESIDVAADTLNSILRVALVTYSNYDPESIDVSADTLDGTLVTP